MNLKKKIKNLKYQNKKIGLVHGVFDVIHYGHIKYFEEAKKLVDYLIVSVTSDKYVNKGANRPIFDLHKRMTLLNSIKFIDFVLPSNNLTAVEVIKKIKPNFYIKGKDYKNLSNDISGRILKEKKEVEKHDGKLIFTKSNLFSSTSIINIKNNFISPESKKLIDFIDKDFFLKRVTQLLEMKSNKKILVIGDPILDILEFVKTNGKANKSNVISTAHLKKEVTHGGILLVLKLLSQFYEKIDFLFIGNKNKLQFLKKIIPKIKIKNIHSSIRIIEKHRYIDNYSHQKLFQNNFYEEDNIEKKTQSLAIDFIKKNHNKYSEIIIFDFGYLLSDEKLIKAINLINKKKITINCQSNSFNFGYNKFNKIKKANILGMDESEFRLFVSDKSNDLGLLIKNNKKKFKNYNYVFITAGKYGCYTIKKGSKIYYSPTVFKENIIDSTGAGDIFLSMAHVALKKDNFDIKFSNLIAHIVAGMHSKTLSNRYKLDNNLIKFITNQVIK